MQEIMINQDKSIILGGEAFIRYNVLPAELQESVDKLMEFAQNYRTDEDQAMQAVLGLAFELDDPSVLADMYAVIPELKVGEVIYPKDVRRYDGVLWQSLSAEPFTVLDNWLPELAPSLWRPHNKTTEGAEVAEWKEHTVYDIGDRVIWQGGIWESVIPNNVWTPEGYPTGWEFVKELDDEDDEGESDE